MGKVAETLLQRHQRPEQIPSGLLLTCSVMFLVREHASLPIGLPVSTCKDPSCRDSAVPVATDSCGVYGTFYMDLMGNRLKTFNSPGRCAKMPHRLPQQQGAETIQIFAKPIGKSLGSQEALPWKQAIRPQPRMGVLRESWEKSHSKQGEDLIIASTLWTKSLL